MRYCNYAFPAVVLALIALPSAVQGFQSGQSDATYHEKTPSKVRAPAKHTEPVPDRAVYPKAALTRVEILPSSLQLVSPRYGQRLAVEGTFADGHQEDLTSEAQIV